MLGLHLFPGACCLLESHWLFDSFNGCWICKLLYQRSDVDFDPRIPVSWRGNEEDCIEGGETVLWNWRCGVTVHKGWDPSTLLQTLLESSNGTGSQKLQTSNLEFQVDMSYLADIFIYFMCRCLIIYSCSDVIFVRVFRILFNSKQEYYLTIFMQA